MVQQKNVTEQTSVRGEVNVVQDIGRVMVRADWWTEFQKRLKESGQTLEEYFTVSVNQEIENALFHDERLLEPEDEMQRKDYLRRYWPTMLEEREA